jgi:hypothetical protein
MTVKFEADYSDCSMVSDDYPMMQRIGYPQLDIKRFWDGEWAIKEYLNPPLIPSLTKWKYVLTGLRNVPVSESFILNQIKSLDPQYSEFWIREIEKEMAVERNNSAVAQNRADSAERTITELLKNEALKERVAKYGIMEMTPERIAYRIAQDSPSKARELGIKVPE